MTLAQRVRDHRYAKGWGPDELAHRASISRTALYQIESGKTEQPRAGTLRRIAQALEIPTELLLGPHLGYSIAPAEVPAHPRPDDRPAPNIFRIDIERKFQELLASPLGEGVARIVEESHRFLPRSSTDSRW